MSFLKSLVLFACMALVGCSSWHKYSYDNPSHEGFESISSVKVPADLTAEQIKAYYPIPTVLAKDTGKPPSLVPPIN
jgi:uncharacterized lipoprotein